MNFAKNVVNPTTIGLLTIVSLGIGACGGFWYQQSRIANIRVTNGQWSQNGTTNTQQRSGRMMGGNTGNIVGQNTNGGMMGRGAVTGEVTAKDDKSITVKMNDGSSRIVIVGTSTTYSESAEAKADKVIVGSKVAVFGTTTVDGTTTATSIELNPALRGQTTK
ncbi:MAG: hypothetical protein WCL07_02325 [bacterium]